MPVTATPIFPQTIRNAATSIVNADGTTLKTLISGGADGTQVNAITVASTDSTSRDLRLWIGNGSNDFLLDTVQIPVSSGNTNAAAPVDVLRSATAPGLAFDALGNRVIYLESGWSLKVSVAVAVTSGQTISVVVPSAGDY